MIELEFLSAKRKELIGRFKSFSNKLVFGSSENDDVIIEEKDVPARYLQMEVTGDGLWCENREGTPFYHSNSKKISGRKLCQISDIIQLGETSFRILGFTLSSTKLTKEALLKQYDKVITEKPDLKPVLDSIEHELVQVQYIGTKKKNVQE